MTIIRFRRGDKIELPASAPSGMPLWCEDTKELYMGTNDSVTPIIANNSNEVSLGYIPYSVNSGNQDSNGYADLIQKVSDTEVSFKLGGAYPYLGVTFPNGKFYTISSIANVTGLSNDSVYIFVLIEDNLSELEDGTYSATVNAVSVGYVSQDNLVPIMQSNSQDGFTVNAYNPKNDSEKANAYTLFDRNNSTGISFSWGWGNGLYATLNYFAPIKMTRCQFYAPTSSGSLSGIVRMKAYGSNDGTNWTEVLDTGDMRSTGNIRNSPTFNCHSPDYYTNYKFQVITVNLVGGYSSTTSNLRTINPQYDQEFLGGKITEDVKFPEDYDSSIVPVKTANTGDGSGWTSSANDNTTGMEAYKAFDGNYDANNRWYTGVNNIGWLKISKDSGTFNISRIGITAPEDSSYTSTPKDFTIKDEAENILATFTNQVYAPNETKYFDVIATGVSAIKIDVTSTNDGSGITAKEVRLYETVTSADGDYHLLIIQKPLKPYRRESSGWVEKQFIKLGQVQKLSGLLGTPISYAFNGTCTKIMPIPSNKWQAINVDVNIGSEYQAQGNLICKNANNGYSSGQRAFNFLNRNSAGGSATFPPLKYYDQNTLMLMMCEAYAISRGSGYMNELLIGYGSTTWEVELIAKRSF